MKKLLIGSVMFIFIGMANAAPLCGPLQNEVCVGPTGAALPLVALGAIALAVSDTLHPQACDNEPLRTVSMSNSNVTFTVAGCEYEANKAKYTVR